MFALDGEIDDMEREIEGMCTKLLLRQPVAKDLRRITAALKMVTDLERIGDQASDIAELARFIRKGSSQHSHLNQMATDVVKMISESVDAFIHLDIDRARQVIAYDDVVDQWFDKLKSELVTQIATNKEGSEELLDVFMVAKYLERIGDQSHHPALGGGCASPGRPGESGLWVDPDTPQHGQSLTKKKN